MGYFETLRPLLAAGLITNLDRMAMAALVAAWTRWLETQKQIAKTGLLIRPEGEKWPRMNPLLRVAREAEATYTRLLSDFGLTPSSRSKLSSTKPAGDDDPFAAMFGDRM